MNNDEAVRVVVIPLSMLSCNCTLYAALTCNDCVAIATVGVVEVSSTAPVSSEMDQAYE